GDGGHLQAEPDAEPEGLQEERVGQELVKVPQRESRDAGRVKAPPEEHHERDGEVDGEEQARRQDELPEPQVPRPSGRPRGEPAAARCHTLISRFHRLIHSARCRLIFGQSSVFSFSRSWGVAGTMPRHSAATWTPSTTGPMNDGGPAMVCWLSTASPWLMYWS